MCVFSSLFWPPCMATNISVTNKTRIVFWIHSKRMYQSFGAQPSAKFKKSSFSYNFLIKHYPLLCEISSSLLANIVYIVRKFSKTIWRSFRRVVQFSKPILSYVKLNLIKNTLFRFCLLFWKLITQILVEKVSDLSIRLNVFHIVFFKNVGTI